MSKDIIELTELIDVATLQKIQDAFANATGMAALTVDLNGPVTELSNPTDFCMNLTRTSKIGAKRCNECDLKGGKEAGRTGRPAVYYCHGGLMDFAAPILVEGRQVGSLIGGQVLPVPYEEKKIRQIAKEIQVNETEYVKAISKIRVVPKKNIEAAAQLLYVMANTLSDMGYQKYKTIKLNQELTQVGNKIHNSISHIVQSMKEAKAQNDKLSKNFQLLSNTTEQTQKQIIKTNEIIKYINDISMRTRLLGFNASVEAARAGVAGKSFSIIAEEIRNLAESSSSQANDINKIINMVKESVSSVDDQLNITNEDIKYNMVRMNEVSEIAVEMDTIADSLIQLSKQIQKI